MSYQQQVLTTFKEHGGSMTLGQILKYTWGYSIRSTFSRLRKQGYTVDLLRGNTPSENLYTIIEPQYFQQELKEAEDVVLREGCSDKLCPPFRTL